jgi:transcriptional regulator with XRE-family HTH domain
VRSPDVGPLVRAWRNKRRMSQMRLALDAGVSPRHLSFVESGRARPSPELLMALADRLTVPLRARNDLLLAAGFAPRFPEHALGAPQVQAAEQAVRRLLELHEPYPGLALDGHRNIVLANAAAQRLLALLPPHLARPPVNLYRASLHPEGFAAVTTNFTEWGTHLLEQLEALAEESLDGTFGELLAEIMAYPNVRALAAHAPGRVGAVDQRILLPVELLIHGQRLAFFTTLVRFGSVREVTLSELLVELFYPVEPPLPGR